MKKNKENLKNEYLKNVNLKNETLSNETINKVNLSNDGIGRISEVQKNSFTVRYEGKDLPAKLKGDFYMEDKGVPIVGDYVIFTYNPIGDSVITAIMERKSVLRRPRENGEVQLMVSNFDYVFIVTSLNNNYSFNRVARYVSVTLEGGGIPVVILSKVDLCSNPGRYVREIEEVSDKVRVHTISALYGIGLDELDEYIKPGKTIAILGSSGVGKSTLINALCGGKIMETGDIRESDDKGRHTTTYRQLIELESGAVIIDTPGMRSIGMVDVGDGIDETFSDIVELASRCRFNDCRHETEPGCMVKRAMEEGALSEERLMLYKRMHRESDKNTLMKNISKHRKVLNTSEKRKLN